jgi:drug/metabolite transporter (DMT)-like permease
VWTQAPIAPASALRDTSAIFATLIAATVLKERIDARVITAVLLATAGAVSIRLA